MRYCYAPMLGCLDTALQSPSIHRIYRLLRWKWTVMRFSSRAAFYTALGSLPILGSSAKASTQSNGTLEFSSTSYLYPPTALEKESTFTSFWGNWAGQKQGDELEVVGRGTVLLMTRPATLSYFDLPEAYLGTSSLKKNVPLEFQVGRKIQHWNLVDERWKMGIWQPRFRWDALRPENVGLIGLFLGVDRPLWRAHFYASPLFIPERGAPVNVNADGRIVSDSPWFISPVDHARIFGQDTRIRYQIGVPPISDLVFKGAVGGQLAFGGSKGFWSSAAYAYQPINQLLLSHDARAYDHVSQDIPATLYPRVGYHHLASAEAGHRSKRMDWALSVMGERPVPYESNPLWVSQSVSNALTSAAFMDWRPLEGHFQSSTISLSYLRQWGGNAADQVPEGRVDLGSGGSVFENRYPFQNALKVGGKSILPGKWGRNFLASSEVLYDLGHQGNVWSTELRFSPHRDWVFDLGADFLTSDRKYSGTTGANDFIYRYRANDRVHAGVTYVF